MKVKIKENINLVDLKEDSWNGCKYDTMLFLQKYYDENKTFEVEQMSGMDNYIIMIEGKDWVINPKVFEIIEEDKKIKKLDIRNEKNCKNNWKWKVYGEKHSYNISTPQKIIADKINEIIDYLEENK